MNARRIWRVEVEGEDGGWKDGPRGSMKMQGVRIGEADIGPVDRGIDLKALSCLDDRQLPQRAEGGRRV